MSIFSTLKFVIKPLVTHNSRISYPFSQICSHMFRHNLIVNLMPARVLCISDTLYSCAIDCSCEHKNEVRNHLHLPAMLVINRSPTHTHSLVQIFSEPTPLISLVQRDFLTKQLDTHMVLAIPSKLALHNQFYIFQLLST